MNTRTSVRGHSRHLSADKRTDNTPPIRGVSVRCLSGASVYNSTASQPGENIALALGESKQ